MFLNNEIPKGWYICSFQHSLSRKNVDSVLLQYFCEFYSFGFIMLAKGQLKEFITKCLVTQPLRVCLMLSLGWVVAVEEAVSTSCTLSPCACQLLRCSSPSPDSCPSAIVRVLCKRRRGEKKESTSPLLSASVTLKLESKAQSKLPSSPS